MNYCCLFRAHPCTKISVQSCYRASQALQTLHPRRMHRPGDAGMESAGGLLPAVPCAAWAAAATAVHAPSSPGATAPAIPLPFLGSGSDTMPWIPAQPGQAELSSRWVRVRPELRAPVSSPAKRSSSSMPAPQTQLTFSTEFVFTFKYSPLALNLFTFWSGLKPQAEFLARTHGLQQ